jgi:O-antigen/teichoic acid export membrane protein
LVLAAVAILVCIGGLFLLYPGSPQALTREAIALLAVQFLLAAPGGAAVAHLTAHQRAAPAALGTLLASALFLASLGTVVALDAGYLAIAAAYTLAALAAPVIPAVVMLRRTRLHFTWDRQAATAFARTAIPQGVLLVLAVVYFRIDTVLLSLLSSHGQVAIYALAYKVAEFFAFLPVYFMATLFPVIARTPPRTRRLNELVSGATSSLVVAGIAVLTILVTFAPEIVAAIAPRVRYQGAVGVLRLLGVSALLIFVTNGFFQTLVALSRQRSLTRLTAVVLVANVALNCGLIPLAGAEGAAWALIGTELISLGLVLAIYRQVGELPRLQRMGRVLVASAGLALVGWLVERLLFRGPHNPVLALACGLAGGGSAYVVLLRLLRALPPQLEAVLSDIAERTRYVMRLSRGGHSQPEAEDVLDPSGEPSCERPPAGEPSGARIPE